MRVNVHDVVGLIGAALMGVGAGLWWLPAGFMTAGAALFGLVIVTLWRSGGGD